MNSLNWRMDLKVSLNNMVSDYSQILSDKDNSIVSLFTIHYKICSISHIIIKILNRYWIASVHEPRLISNSRIYYSIRFRIYDINLRSQWQNYDSNSQSYLKNCQTFWCSGNLYKMLCIDSSFTLFRLLDLTHYEVSFIQEITMIGTYFYSVSFSFDGSILLVSNITLTSLIFIKLSGGQNFLAGSYELPSAHLFMTIYLDGLYNLRQNSFKRIDEYAYTLNNNTWSHVVIYTIATALKSSIVRISIRNIHNTRDVQHKQRVFDLVPLTLSWS